MGSVFSLLSFTCVYVGGGTGGIFHRFSHVGSLIDAAISLEIGKKWSKKAAVVYVVNSEHFASEVALNKAVEPL